MFNSDNIFNLMSDLNNSDYCVEWWFNNDLGSDFVYQFVGTPYDIAVELLNSDIDNTLDIHLLDRDIGVTMPFYLWSFYAREFLNIF